jgi:hypothetical protein
MIASRGLRIWAAVSLTALGLIVVAVFIALAHWWIRARGMVVTCGKSACLEARVYKSWGGDILVSIDDYEWYLVFPESQRIGIANKSNFFRLHGCVYSRNAPPFFTLLNPVKSITPELLVENKHIEFYSLNQGRVSVTWSR